MSFPRIFTLLMLKAQLFYGIRGHASQKNVVKLHSGIRDFKVN